MDKKIKLALLALLGFSTACSSVKNAPKDKDNAVIMQPIVMYGVRLPDTGAEAKEMQKGSSADDSQIEKETIRQK